MRTELSVEKVEGLITNPPLSARNELVYSQQPLSAAC
ncbi:MAG: hypothetical protein ACI8RZ_006642, partial [Myxococcota bacterium]